MRLTSENIALANELRLQIQRETNYVGDGEAVAMTLLWTFLLDHAQAHRCDVEELARHQMNAFIEYARTGMQMRRADHAARLN